MLSIYSENNSLNTDKTIEIDNSNQRWWYDTLPTKPMDLHSAIQYDYHNEPHLYLSSWIVIKTTSLSNDNHHTFARKIYLNSMKSRTWMHVLPLTVGWMRERRRMKKRESEMLDWPSTFSHIDTQFRFKFNSLLIFKWCCKWSLRVGATNTLRYIAISM